MSDLWIFEFVRFRLVSICAVMSGGLSFLFRVLSLVFFFGLFFFIGDADGAEVYDDIVISHHQGPQRDFAHGYIEYAFTIVNNSPEESHKVTLELPKNSNGSSDFIYKMRREVVVGAGSSAKVSIFQPAIRMNGSDISVYIDGVLQKKVMPFSPASHIFNTFGGGSTLRVGFIYVLLSREVGLDVFEESIANTLFPEDENEEKVGLGFPSLPDFGRGEPTFVKAQRETNAWSDNMLEYTSYDGVVLNAAEFRGIAPGVGSALLDYVRGGGTMLVLGDYEPDDQIVYGHRQVEGFDFYYIDFGLMVVDSSGDVAGWSSQQWEELINNAWGATFKGFSTEESIEDANRWFPVVEDITIPIKGLFVIILVFVIFAGPVNLLFLSRADKRMHILWSVPLLSIVMSMAVFFYAMFGEGWQGIIRGRVLTVLDQEARRASSIGVIGVYSPLTPSNGLVFDYDTVVHAHGIRGWQSGRPRKFDWSDRQSWTAGAVAARVPAHFSVVKSQPARQRFSLTRNKDSTIDIVNGIGTKVKRLYYADEDGRVYAGADIAAGAQARLERMGERQVSITEPDRLRWYYTNDIVNKTNGVLEEPWGYLEPGVCIAVVEDFVFLEEPLENTKDNRIESIIYCLMGD
jgi:hypothetical protein